MTFAQIPLSKARQSQGVENTFCPSGRVQCKCLELRCFYCNVSDVKLLTAEASIAKTYCQLHNRVASKTTK